MNIRRRKGIEKEISKIIGFSILTEVKNEKIRNLVSIKEVTLSQDGKYLDIVFSILNYKENINKEKMLEELKKLTGFFRTKLSKELNLRYTPEIRMKLDDTLEHSMKIEKLLNEIKKEEKNKNSTL